MQVLKVWDYQVWDGGSSHKHKAYFDRTAVSEADAKIIAGTYDIMTSREIVIYHSIQEYETEKAGKVRERALSKLTVEERESLGF